MDSREIMSSIDAMENVGHGNLALEKTAEGGFIATMLITNMGRRKKVSGKGQSPQQAIDSLAEAAWVWLSEGPLPET